MLEPHLLNLANKNQYKHVMLTVCTPAQSSRYITKLAKVLKDFITKVVIFSCPSETSTFNGYVGMRVQILALPEVHSEVSSLVSGLSF